MKATENNSFKGSIEEQLLHIILNDLMSLPAYKLNNKYREILEKYTYVELNKSINQKTPKQFSPINNNYSIEDKSIAEIYRKPNQWEMFLFSFKSLPRTYKLTGLIAIISFAFAFLSRANNPLLRLIGVVFSLIFSFSFLIFFMEFGIWESSVKNTFSIIDRLLDDINDYIRDFGDINENNLQTRSNLILENIIKDEISSLNYDLNKINIFNILFAFFISFIFIYIMGDSSIEGIQRIADLLKLGDFKYIKELSTEKFAIFVLFPVGIALSKDIVVSGLRERNKRLRRSLVIIVNRFHKQNFSIQSQGAFSENPNYPKESAQNSLLSTAIYWYQKGEISLEKAAQIADLNIRDFLEVLARKKIDVFTIDFDDLAARHCAKALGIPVRGTLGLVLIAKQRNAIPSARQVLEKLRLAGMYLSDRVMNQALAKVGE